MREYLKELHTPALHLQTVGDTGHIHAHIKEQLVHMNAAIHPLIWRGGKGSTLTSSRPKFAYCGWETYDLSVEVTDK